MKNFLFRSGKGLVFIALFILNIGLVVTAVITTNYLLIAMAIVLSCAQFYLHDRFGRSHRSQLCTTQPSDRYKALSSPNMTSCADDSFSPTGTLMEMDCFHNSYTQAAIARYPVNNFQRNRKEATYVLMQRCGYEHLSEAGLTDFFSRVGTLRLFPCVPFFGRRGWERYVTPWSILTGR